MGGFANNNPGYLMESGGDSSSLITFLSPFLRLMEPENLWPWQSGSIFFSRPRNASHSYNKDLPRAMVD